MVVYIGRRDLRGKAWVVKRETGEPESHLSMRLDLYNHSPNGFEWSYGGSRPAQLALAMLADCLPDDPDLAVDLHQAFKWEYVARFAKSGFVMDQYDVNQWIFAQLDRYEVVPISIPVVLM